MRRLSRERGFSFIEILVVMAIIAVLVGLGVGVYMMAIRKAPETRTKATLAKMRANIDSWRGTYKSYPPSDLNRIPMVTGVTLKIGRANPMNTTNWGVESLYQALRMKGFSHDPDLNDSDLLNTDQDALDTPFASNGNATLWEIKDGWDSPLVYFVEADYRPASKDPPTYMNGDDEAVNPKPVESASGGFAQPGSYQLFSMGPDRKPNTEDDIFAWEAR